MKIFNLTDKNPPWFRVPRKPRDFKHRGVIIIPGGSHEFKDEPLAPFAGWIKKHVISVDSLPAWYHAARAPVAEVSSEEDEDEE